MDADPPLQGVNFARRFTSISGHAARRPDYGSLLRELPHVPPAYCYRCPFGLEPTNCALECAQAWDRVIQEQDPGTVAAVIVEPIVGAAGGVLMPPTGVLERASAHLRPT